MQRRDALAALVIALVSGLVFASPATDIAHGLSIDVLTALRWQLFGQREKPEAAPTAVIVLDEESFNIDPFKSSLVSTWTPEIGKSASVWNAETGTAAAMVPHVTVMSTPCRDWRCLQFVCENSPHTGYFSGHDQELSLSSDLGYRSSCELIHKISDNCFDMSLAKLIQRYHTFH